MHSSYIYLCKVMNQNSYIPCNNKPVARHDQCTDISKDGSSPYYEMTFPKDFTQDGDQHRVKPSYV